MGKFKELYLTEVKNEDVIDMFIRDSFSKEKPVVRGTPNLKITKMPKDTWALVNFSTPILYRNKKNKIFFNTEKFSATTSKIQSMIRKGLKNERGVIKPTTEVDTDGIADAIRKG